MTGSGWVTGSPPAGRTSRRGGCCGTCSRCPRSTSRGDDANLALAATVVKTALLGARDAADIGVPSVPLGELHGQAAGALLTRLGAQVRLGAKVAAVEVLPGGPGPGSGPAGRAPGLARPGRRRGPDGAAAGRRGPGRCRRTACGRSSRRTAWCWRCRQRSPPGWRPRARSEHGARRAAVPKPRAGHGPAGQPGPAQWRELATSPIVNVHVIYDRRVTRLPFAAAVDSPVQWVFDRTGPSGLRSGQYLAVSLSAADGYVDVPASACGSSSCPPWQTCSRPRATRGSPTSSSPGSGGPRCARCRV